MNITLKKSFIATAVATLFAISTAYAQAPATTATAKPTPAKSDAKKSPPKQKNTSCKPEKGMSVKVKLTTSMGDMTLELNEEKAPISSENFIKYVQSGHYNGTIFHRVIDGFMIQGGGFDKSEKQKPVNASIKNESTNGLKNDHYTVAMARTGVRDSATSQFFINVKNNDFLNYSGETPQGFGYAVFGKIIEGKEVVDKMRAVPTKRTQLSEGQPVETLVLEKAECI